MDTTKKRISGEIGISAAFLIVGAALVLLANAVWLGWVGFGAMIVGVIGLVALLVDYHRTQAHHTSTGYTSSTS